MSTLRLLTTCGALLAVAAALRALAPGPAEIAETLTHAQHVTDTAGAGPVVLAGTALLAWAVWAYGSLGLALTAAVALPGVLGAVAAAGAGVLLPAGVRSAAALTLGVGIGVAGPAAALAAPPAPVPASTPAPDWPATGSAERDAGPHRPAAAGPVPDIPAGPQVVAPAEPHVVVPGDCLWDIAEQRLRDPGADRGPLAGEIADAVRDWHETNTGVIGPDPDLIHPGQVLRPPGPGTATAHHDTTHPDTTTQPETR